MAHHDLGSTGTSSYGDTTILPQFALDKGILLQLALVIRTQELLQDVAPADQVIKLLGCKVALADEALQTVGLLLSVFLVRANLLEDLDVVLGVLVLQGCGEGSSLFDAVTVGRLELGDDGVERLDSATCGIKTTADGSVGAGVAVEVLNESILRTGALVGSGFG